MTCAHLQCDRPRTRCGLCDAHYRRVLKGVSIASPIQVWRRRPEPKKPCIKRDCTRDRHALRLCTKHYQQLKAANARKKLARLRNAEPSPVVAILRQCRARGCNQERIASAPLCYSHYKSLRRAS